MHHISTIEFRTTLKKKHDELSSAACDRDAITIENTADEIDRLQRQLGTYIAIRTLDHTATLLKSVQAALDRIDEGLYGVCMCCEELISEKRLKAIPWASCCLSCQEMIDTSGPAREADSQLTRFEA